jgi:3-hydroxyacyl-[acyl-carrier-protein] dehydratase
MSRAVAIEIPKILEILPHRYPFVLVDRVVEIVPHDHIVGYKMVSYNEPWTMGHFPGNPVMPGVLVIEALAQVSGILAYASDPFDPSTNLMYFLGVDKMKFRHTVTPGDRLDLHARVAHHRSNVWKMEAEATVDSTLCAQGQLLASIVDRD